MLDLTQSVASGLLKQIDSKTLSIKFTEGSLSEDKPCFVCDEENHEYVILSAHLLQQILQNMKQAQEERFAMSLEKDIANLMPLDFDDVLSVAKQKLEELNLDIAQVDTQLLAKTIKQEYPNLFFNFDDYLRRHND
ncbi:DUF2603 domain-containing protein [Helicobacter cholecystus]|uniref:UPF0763 protein CQA62_01850 n=1 Tax=Helicobacter cholecystus TaxID=45498 RepID=A0A3D8IWY3_9HELI|nr:DUF2603 domain-containing protein [Helicobacter cholecystus]RDU69415.1 DUF2603 domain-containing protein [Helicobacter cholecystus]VEJ23963.1 Protein of uncharacterised function (DUF2603) [Helicobacter cholecystus]